jgi:hypothetical protein
MSSTIISVVPPFVFFPDREGEPLEDGNIYIGIAGLNPLIEANRIAIYADTALTIPVAQPVKTQGGLFVRSGSPTRIYVAVTDYSIVITDKNGELVYSATNVAEAFQLDWQDIVYPQTASETAAATIPGNVVPANLFMSYGWATRFKTNTNPSATDMVTAIQTAMDAADRTYPEVFLTSELAISKPLIIRAASQQNLSLIGTGRVSTILNPLSANISVAPDNVNAMIINKSNAGALHMRHVRFLDNAGYVGKALYCVEGGADPLDQAQALFSATFDDIWWGFSTNNSGFCQGGFSNLLVFGCVTESSKNATWWLKGVGNGDQSYTDNICNNGYDHFLYQDPDDNLAAIIKVCGLKLYQWQRDTAINLCKAVEVQLTQIDVEVDPANVGSTGVARLKNVLELQASQLMTVKTNTNTRAAIGLYLNGVRGKISDSVFEASTGIEMDCTTVAVTSISNAASAVVTTTTPHGFQSTQFVTHFGLPGAFGAAMNGISLQVTRISATTYSVLINSGGFGAFGAPAGTTQADLEVELHNVDLTGCEYGINFLGAGARFVTGTLRTYGCKFNRMRQYAMLHQFESYINWYSHDDEFLDAGLDGGATARILSLGSRGEIVLIRPRIGRTRTDAAASYCIDAYSTGTVRVIDPIIVGTMPSGVDSSMPTLGAQYPFTPNVGGTATYTTQQGIWNIKGGRLHFSGRMTVNAIGTGSATVMSGLPFVSHATQQGDGHVPFFAASATAVTSLGMTVAPGTQQATMRSLVAAGAGTANNNIFQNATDIIFHGSYPLP